MSNCKMLILCSMEKAFFPLSFIIYNWLYTIFLSFWNLHNWTRVARRTCCYPAPGRRIREQEENHVLKLLKVFKNPFLCERSCSSVYQGPCDCHTVLGPPQQCECTSVGAFPGRDGLAAIPLPGLFPSIARVPVSFCPSQPAKSRPTMSQK